MQTVVIYDDSCQAIRFAVVEGDYSHLDRVYINETDDEGLQDQLSDLVFDTTTWTEKLDFSSEFPTQAVAEGAKVITCGFLA